MALTDKREQFVQWLVKGKSQREAYKLAGYKTDVMTDNAIDVEASKLFKNPEVSLRYGELHSRLVKEAADECIVSAKDILREYAKLGFSDITNYLKVTTRERTVKYDTPEGVVFEKEMMQSVDLYDTELVDPIKMHAVAEIKQTKDGISLKLHDKKGALDSMAKHLGMFVDKVEHSGNVGVSIVNNIPRSKSS